MVPCLTEQGIPARHSGDGGVIFGSIPQEQNLLQAEAMYRCLVRFPTHPMYLEPLTDKQLTLLYGYLLDDLTACLEAEGYEVPSSPPSLEVFIASYNDPRASSWHPYPDDPRLRQPDEWNRLNLVCPQNPPLDVLYGNQ